MPYRCLSAWLSLMAWYKSRLIGLRDRNAVECWYSAFGQRAYVGGVGNLSSPDPAIHKAAKRDSSGPKEETSPRPPGARAVGVRLIQSALLLNVTFERPSSLVSVIRSAASGVLLRAEWDPAEDGWRDPAGQCRGDRSDEVSGEDVERAVDVGENPRCPDQECVDGEDEAPAPGEEPDTHGEEHGQRRMVGGEAIVGDVPEERMDVLDDERPRIIIEGSGQADQAEPSKASDHAIDGERPFAA